MTKVKTVYINNKKKISIEGNLIRIDAMKWNAKDDFDYDSMFFDKEELLKALDELLKNDK